MTNVMKVAMDTTCFGNIHQEHHKEYNLLFDTLKNIWENYLRAFNNDNVKEHWLKLFLFNFQFVSEDLMEDEEFQIFFNPIPEKMCSYLLEQIYEIISKSYLYTPSADIINSKHLYDDQKNSVDGNRMPEKNKKRLQLLSNDCNFAELTLKPPKDCSKIIALRQFLTHQLGQHLLEFLLRVDLKLVASHKSLANLCINLFPDCPWSESYCELNNKEDIFAFIGNLEFYQKLKTKSDKNAVVRQIARKSVFKKASIKLPLEDFQQSKKTSDEIALILIKILLKCISYEHFAPLPVDQSTFISALNFTLDGLSVENQTFSSLQNAEVIKCYLLKLNAQCLNCIFSFVDKSPYDINFQCIFAKLIAALQCNSQATRVLYALIYIIFAILHNVVVIFSQKTLWNGNVNFYDLKFIDENMINCCLSTMEYLFIHEPPEENDIKSLCNSVFRTLIKIIENLNSYDMIVTTLGNNCLSVSSNSTGVPCRKMRSKQLHCLSDAPKLSCNFQNVLIKILPALPKYLQEQSTQYLARSSLCCCHYNLSTMNSILSISLNLKSYYQKCVYKFLYYKMLNTLFLKSPFDNSNNIQSPLYQKRSAVFNCTQCDMKLRSFDFHRGLLKIYKSFYSKLQNNTVNLNNIVYFLKHLKPLSFLLTNDIAAGVLAEIVLPIFRKYKSDLLEGRSNHHSPSGGLKFWRKSPITELRNDYNNFNSNIKSIDNKNADVTKLLYECLNVFSTYLRDIRLIKAFYNDENIKHLEDLLDNPYLIRGACDLIKIGIDNITFLGDNNKEQSILSRRLIMLQLNSSERAQLLFNSLLMKVKNINKSNRTAQFWLSENTPSQITIKPDNMQMQTVDILHIVALQWTLNYELLKTSQYFYNEFAKIYSINNDDDYDNEKQNTSESDLQSHNSTINIQIPLKCREKTLKDILQLNYNALTAFLMLLPKLKSKAAVPTFKQSQIIANYEFDSSWDILENFINSIHSPDTISLSSLTTSDSSVATQTTYILPAHGITNFTEYPNDTQQSVPQLSFLTQIHHKETLKLQENSLNESITIFDIRNQKHLLIGFNNIDCFSQQANTTENSTPSTVVYVDPEKLAINPAAQVSNEGIINKLFNVLGAIFSLTRANSLIDFIKLTSIDKEEEDHEDCSSDTIIDLDLLPLFEPYSNCKKLLLKIFEATMAICIKSYQNEQVEKMQKHLRKLKGVIIAYALDNWEQYAEEPSKENSVIQALQSLLKIAELSHCVNQPVPAISTSISTSAGEDQTNRNEIRARAKSFNSSRLGDRISYRYRQLSTILPSKNSVLTPTTPPMGLLSANSYETDYFSTHASYFCADSELEYSENDQDDFYLTADEGYEADGEIQDISETEGVSEAAEFWHSYQPSSRYRTHILNDGICRLVVDVLIELSEKCAQNPLIWCDSLAQLINRLVVIREYLGGPLFLLKGFAPVLKCNDDRLRELQQSILELINDLNTPDVLSTYFGILSSKNPPVDILVKYMNYICTNTLKKCQPTIELEFPANIDGQCVSTSNPSVTENINRIRNDHLHCQINTPLTRSPCIIPITHSRLWNSQGFTVSLWLQAKGSPNCKNSSQIIEDDKSSSDVYMKSHILSVGTNHVMLSMYLNNNLNLTFETFKPNAEVSAKIAMTTNETIEKKQYVVINGSQVLENKRSTRNQRQKNFFNRDSTSSSSGAASGATSPLSKAFKNTKFAFLNSFSSMNLFNGNAEADVSFEKTHLDLKQFRLIKNKWTHITFAVEIQNDALDLSVLIDGLQEHCTQLPFRNILLLTKNHTFQVIALGDSNIFKSPQSISSNDSRSTFDSFPIRVTISNIMLFNRAFNKKEDILNLTAMGPDFTEFTQCHVANWKPNYGFLNANKLQSAYLKNHVDSLKTLRDMRILCYSASHPHIVMCYGTTADLANITYGHPCGLIHYGEFVQNSLPSLQTATILCGGLSNLLYLFARVVEISPNSTTQSMALNILLNVAFSDSQLYTEFQRIDGINLIGYVLKTERCTKDCNLLRSIINNACSQTLISKKGDVLQVNDTTTAAVVYPKLFTFILHRYSDWHRSGVESSDVLDMLFQSILALTREDHPHHVFNIEQFAKEGLIKELFDLCRVYVIESPNPVFISKKAAEGFVDIISVFAGSPPKSFLLDEIMKLLLLLHKPSECYITHDRSKFYFLLTTEIPAKDKYSNFGRVTASFKKSPTKSRILNVLTTNSNSNSASEINAAKQVRINRLKKLHKTVSEYYRALEEFEDYLENTADCTNLNKHALRLVNPNKVLKWRFKYKKMSIHCRIKHRHVHALYKTRTQTRIASFLKKSSLHIRANSKRIRLSTTNSNRSLYLTDDEKHMRLGRRESDTNLPSANMPFPKSSVFNEFLTTKTSGQHRKSKLLHKTDSLSTVGIATLQSGLLILLKNFLCLLPDCDIDDVLNHYIKVEFLLVLANHNSTSVRSAVIKLISVLMQRLFPHDIQVCIKSLYPHHLANQLSIGFCNSHMFESCLHWVCGIMIPLDTILNCDINLRIQNSFGLNALLAIASKSVATSNIQQDFSEKAFKAVKQLYLQNADEQQAMIEVGLIQCCVKALYHLYSKTTSYNTKTEESIADLLEIIGEMSMKSIGHMNIIWDVINMLSFYQEKQPQHIIKSFRSVQATLQLNWLNMFFVPTAAPLTFKVSQLPNFSMSETKTRLELMINRCCQFYMIFNEKVSPSQSETELFKTLVSYSISTNLRCNNFIAWGLQPSQPRSLRCFIVNTLLISCDDELLPAIICDGKRIKSLLWLSLLEDLDEPIENLQPLCKRLGINENNSTWNLENELQRMDWYKTSEAAKQKTSLEKTIYRFESLAQGCIESSMITTRRVAELQNSERKLLMNYMKDYDDTYTHTKWLEIVRRLTHEGAPWFSEHNREKSWELDNTEGPGRVHIRLRKCHLDLDKRFFMQDYNGSNGRSDKSFSGDDNRSEYSRPLHYLISSYDQQLNISLNSKILYNFPAKYLPVDGEIDGEIIITDHKLYFLATYRCKYFNVNCDISNITEIWLKRYQHQEKAFEIFLDTNQSLFFSLQNQDDYKVMRDVFSDKIIIPPDHSKMTLLTQQWREGVITNWEYLMILNQIAGRTFKDLMQYPVFPWILSNYSTDTLDLMDPTNFRKLAKPISVQNEANEHHYISNYTYMQNTPTNMGSIKLKPYHYSSHYSNSGTVLHFLVRVPPFTSYFLRYQDNNFDIPDRTFHDLSTTYRLASRDSPTDVKELIPEFFCLPEMFENFEGFNFGYRQNGERVEYVELPPWCLHDSRLFVLIHRQALESEIVRNEINHWIDLIFGFKQTGEAAVEAINVFHPATYAVFLESERYDPIERDAVETMVKTYGQMPRQLFKSPHPQSKPCPNENSEEVLSTVYGLRWGCYLGSPQLPDPTLGNAHKLLGAEYLLSFNNTNVVYALPARSSVMQGAEADTYNVISWGYDDHIVRIQPLNKVNCEPKNLVYSSSFDDITACGSDANSNQLWFGHKSGRLSIYKCCSVEVSQRIGRSRQGFVKGLKPSYNSAFRKITSKAMDSDVDLSSSSIPSSISNAADAAALKQGADLCWSGPTVLIRHTDEITCIALSIDFKIVVTAGKDGIAVIWDLNNWSYVRSIERPAEIHHSPITLLSISPTLGDIATVHSLKQQQSTTTISSSDKPIYTSTSVPPPADECFEVTEENLDDFVNVSINLNGESLLRVHSINAKYIECNFHDDRILAVCYSHVKEGIGVNVIATGGEGGIVRLWSSWDLSIVREIVTGLSNIRSLTYTTHQHLVVLTEQSHIQVWETKGLGGSAPKFPQIDYK